MKVDIWAAGLIVFELATGVYCVPVKHHSERFVRNLSHFRSVATYIDKFPQSMLSFSSKTEKYFTASGQPKGKKIKHVAFETQLKESGWPAKDARELGEFLKQVLVVDYKQRPSASEVLQMRYMN